MKHFLKKVNRGLVLGGIILVVFIIYIFCDMNAFKKMKPEITQAFMDYISDMETIAVTPESERDFDGSVGDEFKADFSSKVNEFMSKHWIFENSLGDSSIYYYGIGMNDFKNNLMLITDDEKAVGENYGNGYVSKWNAKPYNIEISKAGPNHANVSFECDVVVEFAGNPYIVSPAFVMPALDVSYDSDYSEKLSKMTVTGNYSAVMKRKDGKWKIAYIDWNGWNSNVTSLDEEEGGTV